MSSSPAGGVTKPRRLAGLVVGVVAIFLVSVVGAISLLLLTLTAAASAGMPHLLDDQHNG